MFKPFLGGIRSRLFRASKNKPNRELRIDDIDLATQAQLILPYFDEGFYTSNSRGIIDAGMAPIQHYCAIGWREGRKPSQLFDDALYCLSNPAASEGGFAPLMHFALASLGTPHAVEQRLQADITLARPFFDTTTYLAQNPDVAAAGLDPVQHFCQYGWREGRNPNTAFDVRSYLGAKSFLVGLGLNPFIHSILSSETDPRNRDVANGHVRSSIGSVIDALTPAFDPAYYLHQNPDVGDLGVDPLEHFCLHGWHEGRDPSAHFSVGYYLQSNPDVAESGLNPFFHYVTQGQFEGRAGRHPGGDAFQSLQNQTPLEDMVANWRRSASKPADFITLADLKAQLAPRISSSNASLIISVGHDDYVSNSGGVQLCIQQEEKRAQAYNTTYLNIHPADPLPRLVHAEEDPDPVIILVRDGKRLGACHISELIAAVSSLRTSFNSAHVVVHHLMGHLPDAIANLVRACGTHECHLWLHDFFTVCPSYTLQRNAISYCGAPALTSNACRLCLYGTERERHEESMRAFFKQLKVHVLAPSSITARFWKEHSNLGSASLSVCPHLSLDWTTHEQSQVEQARSEQMATAPVTVAFIGTPAHHKGWPNFQRLAAVFSTDTRFRFIYFGARNMHLAGVDHVNVHVTADASDGMIAALKTHSVDLVLNLSQWPETFSFTTHEALAAGAFVLTTPLSGNIAALVEATQRGAVMQDMDDLLAAFTDGRAEELAQAARAICRTQRAQVTLSDMTLTVLAPERMAS